MNDKSNHQTAVELLQELGLKEYEARCFVALSRRPKGTAKEISEISAVPRTRVYDAIRVLETKGLVEVQHSNPKQFRAVPVDEAIETIHVEFVERTETLGDALRDMDPAELADEEAVSHEVWSLSGETGIDARMQQLIDEAEREILLISRHDVVFSDALLDRLRAAIDRGVDIVVGTWNREAHDRIERELPGADVFVSGIEMLSQSPFPDDDTDIGRLLLVDQSAILVSSFTGGEGDYEQAVFGRGSDNGFVAVVRRLMASEFGDGSQAGTTD
jgi:sugar-specific transcriptional regulator TrmB